MPDELGEHVGPEAEEEAAHERRQLAPHEPAAEQVRGERRQDRRRDREHVVGDEGPEERRHGPHHERGCGDRGVSCEVVADGRPDEMRFERVEAVFERVRPPAERPDVGGGIGVPDTRAGAREMPDRVPADREQADHEVHHERHAARIPGRGRRARARAVAPAARHVPASRRAAEPPRFPWLPSRRSRSAERSRR